MQFLMKLNSHLPEFRRQKYRSDSETGKQVFRGHYKCRKQYHKFWRGGKYKLQNFQEGEAGLLLWPDIEENQTFFKGASATAKWADGATQKWSARIKAHTRTLEESEPEPEIPATPVFTVKAYNTGYNLVSWKKVSGAEGYYVYRRPGTGGKWTRIATVKSPSLKYKDTEG